MSREWYGFAAAKLRRSKQAPPVVRAGFGRFVWRLVAVASVAVSGIAILVPGFGPGGDGSFRELNPWRISVRHAPLGTVMPQGALLDCALSTNGALLATVTRASAAGARSPIVLQIWDVGSGKLLRTVAEIPYPTLQLHFSPDSQHILAVTSKRVLRFDAVAGTSEDPIEFPAEVSGKAAFSSDGKSMAIPNTAGTVYVLSLPTGKVSRTFTPQRDYARHPETDTLNVAFSPDNNWLAISASADPPFVPDTFPEPAATLSLWDLTTGRCGESTTGGRFVVDSVAFTADASAVITTGRTFEMHIADGYFALCLTYDRRKDISQTGVYNRDDADAHATYLSPNGLHFVAATAANLYVWNAATFQIEEEVPLDSFASRTKDYAGNSIPQPLEVHFSADASRVAVADPRHVRIFHAHGL